jgi:hypothetical protein
MSAKTSRPGIWGEGGEGADRLGKQLKLVKNEF